jgi:hypothetical protein
VASGRVKRLLFRLGPKWLMLQRKALSFNTHFHCVLFNSTQTDIP